jgi:diguanylate cyclase (GGDEF)-like protein
MASVDLAVSLVQVVIFAAGLAAIPIIYRAGGRWYTYLTLGIGLAMVSVPAFLQFWLKDRLSPYTTAWETVAEAGYAVILLGLLQGLRILHGTMDKLHKANLDLAQQAATDSLTGLCTRRQVNILLDYGAARARRSGQGLGFIMIDLDWFKRVNDTYGHQAGDAVLMHVGEILKDRLRACDIAARYGGEEFLVVAPQPSLEGLVGLAEDLRKRIEESPTTYNERTIPISASFGVAICQVDTKESVQEAIRKVDMALYAAKDQGHNRVVLWDQVAGETAAPDPHHVAVN